MSRNSGNQLDAMRAHYAGAIYEKSVNATANGHVLMINAGEEDAIVTSDHGLGLEGRPVDVCKTIA